MLCMRVFKAQKGAKLRAAEPGEAELGTKVLKVEKPELVSGMVSALLGYMLFVLLLS